MGEPRSTTETSSPPSRSSRNSSSRLARSKYLSVNPPPYEDPDAFQAWMAYPRPHAARRHLYLFLSYVVALRGVSNFRNFLKPCTSRKSGEFQEARSQLRKQGAKLDDSASAEDGSHRSSSSMGLFAKRGSRGSYVSTRQQYLYVGDCLTRSRVSRPQ